MTSFKPDKVETTQSGITISNCRERSPEFRRIYQADVTGEISIECEVSTLAYGRSWKGTLSQKNGASVWFDPQDPVRQILDRNLVPIVIARCREMFDIDRLYMTSNRREIRDESGTVWQRV